MLLEKSVKHILKVVNYLPVDPKWNKLKGRYVSQYNKNEGASIISKQNEKFLTHCPSCFIAFNEKTKIVRIVPENKKRFLRRLLRKAEDKKPLTKYQAQYLKKADKHKGNKLIIKCAVCKKEIKNNLNKPKKKIEQKQKVVLTQIPSKKKKKKKDKFAGLKQTAVLSVTSKGKLQNHQIKKNIQKKKKILEQEKTKAKTKNLMSKLNVALREEKGSKHSDLNKFLSSL